MKQEITLLQKEMEAKRLAMYLVPTADEHQSEYLPEYYKFRKFLSGFTGSAGTLLVTKESCHLWTDGRYFIQAEKELEGTTIELFRMAEEGVPTTVEYLEQNFRFVQKRQFVKMR